MSKIIPDENYTFQDACMEARKLGILYQKTGMGLRLELSATESVRCTTPLAAREVLGQQKRVPLPKLLNRVKIEAGTLWEQIADLKRAYPELEENAHYQELNSSIIYLNDTISSLNDTISSLIEEQKS